MKLNLESNTLQPSVVEVNPNRSNGLFAFDFTQGKFTDLDGGSLGIESIESINKRLRAIADVRDERALRMLAHTMVGPIFDVARYEAWTNGFFMQQAASPAEVVRVALWSYTGFAVVSSPLAQPSYNTQLGRKYATITWDSIKTAVAIDWDTLAYAGWPMLERMVTEAGWELSRQIDLEAKGVMDTATGVYTGHQPTVSTSMTKASIDAIFKAAAQIGFPIRYVAINRGTVMDMLNWVWPAANNVWWRIDGKSDQVFNNLWVDGYGGASWMLSKDVPAATIYLAGDPRNGGWRFSTPVREAFQQDIDRSLDKWRWDLKQAYYYGNGFNIWRLTIT